MSFTSQRLHSCPQLVLLRDFHLHTRGFGSKDLRRGSGVRHHRHVRVSRNNSTFASSTSLLETSQVLAAQALQPVPGLAPALLVNSLVFLLGINVLLSGLTPAAVAHSWVLGTTIYAAFGLGGYVLVCLYFILGSAVTKVKLEQKQKEGIAEARSGHRSIGSVWGSGIAGAACAVLALYFSDCHAMFLVAFVASFVSKLSDTVSSEIGKAYGKTTFLITTFQPVPRGTEGAISLEGTLAGIAAAIGFSAVALALGQVDIRGAGIATGAAVVANLFESWLGASSQGKLDWLSNDAVNMIQITIASAVAVGIQCI